MRPQPPFRGEPVGRAGLPDALIRRMYRDYLRLGSVAKVGAKYGGRSRQSVFELFKSRGLKLRAKVFKAKVVHDGVAYTLHGGRNGGYLTTTSGARRLLHHVVWEQRHGAIPAGHNVCFRDGNPLNCEANNLVCLPVADATRFQIRQAAEAGRSCAARYGKLPAAVIRSLHAEYSKGASLRSLAASIQRSDRALAGLFRRLNLEVRSSPHSAIRTRRDGALPCRPLRSFQEIVAIADSFTSISVPAYLKRDWQALSLAQRGRILRRIRRRLKSPNDRPSGKFSANVIPFDYATPAAHEIAVRDHIVAPLKLCSQGAIWEDGLWFWHAGHRAYCLTQRPLRTLHRTIWERANARSVPPRHCVCFADSNPNNVAPENLVLRRNADVLAEHSAEYVFRRSREKTELLLKRSRRARRTSSAPLDAILRHS